MNLLDYFDKEVDGLNLMFTVKDGFFIYFYDDWKVERIEYNTESKTWKMYTCTSVEDFDPDKMEETFVVVEEVRYGTFNPPDFKDLIK